MPPGIATGEQEHGVRALNARSHSRGSRGTVPKLFEKVSTARNEASSSKQAPPEPKQRVRSIPRSHSPCQYAGRRGPAGPPPSATEESVQRRLPLSPRQVPQLLASMAASSKSSSSASSLPSKLELLPGPNDSTKTFCTFAEGQRARVVALSTAPEFNGAVGTVTRVLDGADGEKQRVLLRIDPCEVSSHTRQTARRHVFAAGPSAAAAVGPRTLDDGVTQCKAQVLNIKVDNLTRVIDMDDSRREQLSRMLCWGPDSNVVDENYDDDNDNNDACHNAETGAVGGEDVPSLSSRPVFADEDNFRGGMVLVKDFHGAQSAISLESPSAGGLFTLLHPDSMLQIRPCATCKSLTSAVICELCGAVQESETDSSLGGGRMERHEARRVAAGSDGSFGSSGHVEADAPDSPPANHGQAADMATQTGMQLDGEESRLLSIVEEKCTLVEARCSCALEKCLELNAHMAEAHARRVSSERELKLVVDVREKEQTDFHQQLASMAADNRSLQAAHASLRTQAEETRAKFQKEVASLTECKNTLKADCEEKERTLRGEVAEITRQRDAEREGRRKEREEASMRERNLQQAREEVEYERDRVVEERKRLEGKLAALSAQREQEVNSFLQQITALNKERGQLELDKENERRSRQQERELLLQQRAREKLQDKEERQRELEHLSIAARGEALLEKAMLGHSTVHELRETRAELAAVKQQLVQAQQGAEWQEEVSVLRAELDHALVSASKWHEHARLVSLHHFAAAAATNSSDSPATAHKELTCLSVAAEKKPQCGIGITLQQEMEGKGVVSIRRIVPGGSLCIERQIAPERQLPKEGDVVLAIDGKALMDVSTAPSLCLGPEGSSVTLLIGNKCGAPTFSTTILRRRKDDTTACG